MKKTILLLTILATALVLGCIGEKPTEKTQQPKLENKEETTKIENASEDLEITGLELEIEELENLLNDTDTSDTIDIGEINFP